MCIIDDPVNSFDNEGESNRIWSNSNPSKSSLAGSYLDTSDVNVHSTRTTTNGNDMNSDYFNYMKAIQSTTITPSLQQSETRAHDGYIQRVPHKWMQVRNVYKLPSLGLLSFQTNDAWRQRAMDRICLRCGLPDGMNQNGTCAFVWTCCGGDKKSSGCKSHHDDLEEEFCCSLEE